MKTYGRDPVSAIVETEATGEIAGIFADIRETMEIPLLTSIWRTLVSVEGGLHAVWKAAKPLYQTGQPQAALAGIVSSGILPKLEPIVPGQLECVGIGKTELSEIRAIVAAYNRSNGVNMVALTALIAIPTGPPLSLSVSASPSPWPELQPLLSKDEIPSTTWTMLNEVNQLGSLGVDDGLATLWRHLAHWPGFLALIHANCSYMHRMGNLVEAVRSVHQLAQRAGEGLAHLRKEPIDIPEPARQMVENYVAPGAGAVSRMVTMGHSLANWLATAPGATE